VSGLAEAPYLTNDNVFDLNGSLVAEAVAADLY
jgi:hypothetical protein